MNTPRLGAIYSSPRPPSDIDDRLKTLGCPYPNSDPRSSVWLEGRFHDLLKREREAGNSLPSNQ
jgi:hypothetical protein